MPRDGAAGARGGVVEAGDASTPPIRVGTRIDLGVHLGDEGLVWLSTVVADFEAEGDRLLVDWPIRRASYVRLATSQTVLVGAIMQDAFYTTEMAVRELGNGNPRTVLLARAGTWVRQQRRNNVRHDLVLHPSVAELVTPDGSKPVQAVIRNVSAGGLLVRSDVELKVGDRLRVGFAFPEAEESIGASVVVRRVTLIENDSRRSWDAGCAFHGLRRADEDRIVRYIFGQQRLAARRHLGAD